MDNCAQQTNITHCTTVRIAGTLLVNKPESVSKLLSHKVIYAFSHLLFINYDYYCYCYCYHYYYSRLTASLPGQRE